MKSPLTHTVVGLLGVVIWASNAVREEGSLNFLFHGDWGYPGENQTLIAEQMGIWAEKNEAEFVIALGDNFYCE